MLDGIAIAFVLGGLVMLLAGATLSTYAVAGVGALLGGGGGYLFGPAVVAAAGFGGPFAALGAVVGGAAIGIVVTYLLLSVTVAGICFVVGTYAGLTVIAPIYVDGAWFVEWGAAIGLGVGAAAFGAVMTRTALVGVTAFLGAALASRSLTPAALSEARAATSVDPLVFDATAPLFVGLFVLGLAVQVGLFRISWVRKAVGTLPGANTIRNRGGRGEPAER